MAPHTDFNPVLLKPTSDRHAQIIIHGKVATDLDAQAYHAYKPRAMGAVLASWGRLTAAYDCVLVEGAGSSAEINLRDRDIANMGFAEAVDCPVILIADIDRGGVIAHLVGTLGLLSLFKQARIKGFVINRFRGDIALPEPGLDWLEAHTGKPVIGVISYLSGLYLDAEDAIATAAVDAEKRAKLRVVALPTSTANARRRRPSGEEGGDGVGVGREVEFLVDGAQPAPLIQARNAGGRRRRSGAGRGRRAWKGVPP